MTYIIFMINMVKGLVYFVLSDSLALRIFYCVLLIILQRYLEKRVNLPKNVSLFAYKLKNIIVPSFFIILYFSIFIFLLTLYRISNIYKMIDLKKIFSEIYMYLLATEKLLLCVNLMLFIFFLRLLFLVYKQIKLSFIKQFTKLYIYLYQYASFRNALFFIIHHILDTFSLSVFISNKFSIKFKYCRYFIEHFGIFLIIIFLLYDIVFNNMIIFYVLFIIPFSYLYTQIFAFKHFVERRHLINDISLTKFYYIKHIYEDTEGIYLENGDFYSTEDIQNLQEHILQDFKI